MAKKQKYYVVWQGHTPGIYTDWTDCLLQVKGYQNAKYKAFESKEDAEDAFALGDFGTSPKKKKSSLTDWRKYVAERSIAVDAACSGNPGNMEYRGVDIYGGNLLFHVGPLKEGTNNIGEFLAIVHALALLKKNGDTKSAIFSDSRTAISWIKRKKPNTKLTFTYKNKPIQDLLIRAEYWLNHNTFKNPIEKWDTENWGEIPADFGRK
ncbi:MAG: ribonuclease H family protein [Bacteroidota bacterium]|nr:ribonuclease H family protein [Bacteroidota bacterium]